MLALNNIYNGDCLDLMKEIDSESIDVILTDPPYQYLKNQICDVPFDEFEYFKQCTRVLKKGGFIILFGRGTAFYRWNTILSEFPVNKKDISIFDLIRSFFCKNKAPKAFEFKEEIIWNKHYCTSPLMPISRIHETISIHAKNKGKIRRVKVPYLEMKRFHPESIIQDIKRLKACFKNTKSLDAVLKYFEDNERDKSDSWDYVKNPSVVINSNISKENRCVSIARMMKQGMKEKSIIEYSDDYHSEHNVVSSNSIKTPDKCVIIANSVNLGMNEKSIIEELGDHYKTIHPNQKPVRLLERLLNLACEPGAIVLDTFSGSGSTAKACINTNRKYICIEKHKKFYDDSVESVNTFKRNQSLFEAQQ